MRHGDLLSLALQGDLGKPRPALVIQSDLFDEHPSVTVLPVTSEQVDAPLFRITLRPGCRSAPNVGACAHGAVVRWRMLSQLRASPMKVADSSSDFSSVFTKPQVDLRRVIRDDGSIQPCLLHQLHPR